MSPRPVKLPNPQFAEAFHLAREGRFAEAMPSVERELERQPSLDAGAPGAANTLAQIARFAETAGDLAAADRALARATELRPRYADLHFRRGCVLLLQQRRVEARRSLDAAIALNPRYVAARLERALLDAREGLVGDALDALRGLSNDLPVEDARAFQQGLKSLERADWDEADSLLRRGLNLSDPELAEQLEALRADLDGGDAARAVKRLREMLPGRQGYPDLYYLLGLAELTLGHHDDAILALARALELNPEFHDARVQFARALEGAGAGASAQQQLDQVLEHDPAHRGAFELRRAWSERANRGPRIGADEPSVVRQDSFKSESGKPPQNLT